MEGFAPAHACDPRALANGLGLGLLRILDEPSEEEDEKFSLRSFLSCSVLRK